MKEEKLSSWTIFVLRICLSGIFINAGLAHLFQGKKTLARLMKSIGYPIIEKYQVASELVLLSGLGLLLFGIAFLLGVFTRFSAFVLLILLIMITLSVQIQDGIFHGPLWKNIAIAGGLLIFIFNQVNTYSLYPSKPIKS